METTQQKLNFPVRKRRTKTNSQFGKENEILKVSKPSSSSELLPTSNEHFTSKTRSNRSLRKSNGSPPKRNRVFEETQITDSSINDSNASAPLVLIKKLTIKSLEDTGNVVTKIKSASKVSSSDLQQARQTLHVSKVNDLPTREKHLESLRDFLQYHLNTNSSGTLYVSGPPGTGKTASLSKIITLPEFRDAFSVVFVNCTSMKSSGSIYAKICSELNLKPSGKSEQSYLRCIEACYKKHSKMVLLILDEIDQLESNKQSVLYTIFEWPAKFNTKLILIGIANALNLTDRVLPRLQARLELKPELMHFAPYTKDEIIEVLTYRLKEANSENVFSSMPLHLLAAKVASISGDMRRALDIGRRVLELAQAQQALQPIADNSINTTSPNKAASSVDLKLVMDVLNSVYGTTQSFETEKSDALPLQQKVLLCTLLLMLKECHSKDISMGKLYDVYRRVCIKRKIKSLDHGELFSVSKLLEARGIIRVLVKKESRLSKVCLQWNEEEIISALQDQQLLGTILGDKSCITVG